jgi:hypothetical protein
MYLKRHSDFDDLLRLKQLVIEHEERRDFSTAKSYQLTIARIAECDPHSTAGELGDIFYRLGVLDVKAGAGEAAISALAKALGFRRIFFGKGHPKVEETMELIKEIRRDLQPVDSDKIDRRRAAARRVQKKTSTAPA